MGWSTVGHHIRALESAGLIRLVASGKRKIVVRTSADLSDDEARALATLRGATANRIARFAHAHPHVEIRHIAAGLALSKRVVYYHVKQLHGAKLLASTTPTRDFELRATPLLVALLARSDASPEAPV